MCSRSMMSETEMREFGSQVDSNITSDKSACCTASADDQKYKKDTKTRLRNYEKQT